MSSNPESGLAEPTTAAGELTGVVWSPGQALLTVRQVAEFLGMSPKAVYHRAERGQLPGVIHVGRSLRFRRSDLVRFIGEGRGLSPTRSR